MTKRKKVKTTDKTPFELGRQHQGEGKHYAATLYFLDALSKFETVESEAARNILQYLNRSFGKLDAIDLQKLKNNNAFKDLLKRPQIAELPLLRDLLGKNSASGTITELYQQISLQPRNVGARTRLMQLLQSNGELMDAYAQALSILDIDKQNSAAKLFISKNPDTEAQFLQTYNIC